MLLCSIKHNTNKVPLMADDFVSVYILNALVRKYKSAGMGENNINISNHTFDRCGVIILYNINTSKYGHIF